jgi:hypothetical protein
MRGRISSIVFAAFAGISTASWGRLPEYHGSIGPEICMDEASLRREFLDGNLDLMGKKMSNYLRSIINSDDPRIPLPCVGYIYKYMGVLAIVTQKDTAKGDLFFKTVLNVDPRAQLFDLSVPIGIQNMFDGIVAEKRIVYTDEEMFRFRLLPAPILTPPTTKRAELMREKYHDIRSNYYLALDSVAYERLAKLLVGETDPAFQLTNAELIVKIGVSLNRAKKMVQGAESRESEILTGEAISAWADRLNTRINSMTSRTAESGTPVMHTIFGDKDGKKRRGRRPVFEEGVGN